MHKKPALGKFWKMPLFGFCAVLLLIGQPVAAHEALYGLEAPSVQVKDLNEFASKAGLSKEKLRGIVETVLKERGMTVNSGAETPQLDISLTVAKFFGGYAGSYRLQVRDWAGSLKDPGKRMLVSTWEKGGLLTSTKGKFKVEVEQAIKDAAILFVDDYNNANKNQK